ncbi:S-adenosyl-L-methionine-dependent methyltransferase [Podospora appendiculata]|uniref:phosphoethanolamine N-methyltransferase n=1 Tax=Podospora appendiculata TaxID=314037 RepID=A0AAE0XHZ9_9PEZI|nr:S-adenosyl-L-methionine-dependent methyltransferase [Podospora appendiculata]
MGSQSPPEQSTLEKMALYNLDRARKAVAALESKPEWEPADTASFDCMHYLGDAAIANAAAELRLQPGQTVLDLGSGFGGTGRYLYRHHGVSAIGIELQPEIHELATAINQRSIIPPTTTTTTTVPVTPPTSINKDFLDLALPTKVDHIVSFLCIMHIPDRARLFRKASALLQPAGGLYIEDFYAAHDALDADTARLLREVVHAPHLPGREAYTADLRAAGLDVVSFRDVTAEWADFVHRRAVAYRRQPGHETSLARFYDVVDLLFASGQVGGCRITCVNTTGR